MRSMFLSATITFDRLHFDSPVTIGLGAGDHTEGLRVDFTTGMAFAKVKYSDQYLTGIYAFDPFSGWLHHGVIAKKGEVPQYVLNGTLLQPIITPISHPSSTLGASVRLASQSEQATMKTYQGKVDDVRLWKKAKCPEFVKYIYDTYKK